MHKSFASFAFGCRVNQAEKEILDEKMSRLGFSYDSDSPTIFLVNTCAVTAKAEREARQFINQIRKKYPDTKIIVTGCSATKWIRENTSLGNADLYIDNTNKEFAARLILHRYQLNEEKPRYLLSTPKKAADKYIPSGRLLVKIQDGCHRFCTFRIVPYLRGQPKSRKIEDIINTIHEIENTTREVIFTAINTEAFGRDTGENFHGLIDESISRTSVPRISFGSIHPWSITPEFIELYRRLLPQDRLVNFFHIPIQSGSNKILAIMKRGYTANEMMEKLYALAKINPFMLIGADIIVGFLEETDKDFAETYQFLEKSPINKFHIFRFSKRERTAAYFMSKRFKEPSPTEKEKRAKALAELGRKKYQK